ncbi:MAG TPA: hypothetical protein VFI93_06215 [Rhizomicrobium sp.]|jgi:hypothetical protein|nr:hypothetical protein [Rhizomicrobium sp.]
MKPKRGAPYGNSNALKHGKFTQERRSLYAEIRSHVREGRALMETAGQNGARDASAYETKDAADGDVK